MVTGLGPQDPPSLEAAARRATGLPHHSEAEAGAATFRAAFWLFVIAPSLIVSDFRRGRMKYNTVEYGFWVRGNTDYGKARPLDYETTGLRDYGTTVW